MPAAHELTADYWVGSLAMTVATAHRHPEEAGPILKSALKEFLRDRPPGNELGDMIRDAMGGKRV